MIAQQRQNIPEMTAGYGGSRLYSLGDGNSVYFLFFVSIVMIVSGVFLLYFFFSGGEKVREIQISGNNYLKENDILDILSIRKDITISSEEMEKKTELLKKHPAVLNVTMKLMTGTLHVDVTEKNCIAVLRNRDSLYDLFDDMMVNSPRGGTGCHGVPLVTGAFAPADGYVRSDSLAGVASGLALMKRDKPELAHRISEIRIDSKKKSVIVLTSPRLRIEFSGDLTPSLINRVYAAVSYYEKENKSAGWIDLTGRDAILVPGK